MDNDNANENTEGAGRRIFIVGLGSLGSTFCTEAAKRSLALKLPLSLVLVDFDTVEERNVVAQDFTPGDIGSLKTDAVGEGLKGYCHLHTDLIRERVTEDNARAVLPVSAGQGDILVDAVDNFATRRLLWLHAQKFGVPLLHLSMSKKFGGHVQWTYSPAGVDTWTLSPANLSPAQLEALESPREEDVEAADPTLPPCVLNSKRGLIWNTAMAGVNALFILMGHDTQEIFAEALDGQSCLGLLSTWDSSVLGCQPLYDRTEIVSWGT